MRKHNFELNATLFPLDAVVLRLRAYIRYRFGRGVPPKKGRAQHARRARLLICKPWKR
jgi:hypothetical protein